MDTSNLDFESLKAEFPGWDGVLPLESSEWTKEEVWFFVGSGGYMRPSKKTQPKVPMQAAIASEPYNNTQSSFSLPSPSVSSVSLSPPHTNVETMQDNASFQTPEIQTIKSNGVCRFYFNVDKWQPTSSEWELALSQLESEEEKAKCCRFVFERDRKLALGSRLLQRYAVRETLGLENYEFSILRTKEGKPVLSYHDNLKVQQAMKNKGYINFNMNATHHGCIVAVALEPIMTVGVDVMNEREFLGGSQTADEFIIGFEKDFSGEEMNYVMQGGEDLTDQGKFARFCRAWTLKEAYIKAHGIGFGIELKTLSFYQVKNGDDSLWGVYVDNEEPSPKWTFHIQKVDEKHTICVCRAPPQHCHEEFVKHLPLSHLSREQCVEGSELSQPSFLEVTLPALIPQVQKDLFRVRHLSFCLEYVDIDANKSSEASSISSSLSFTQDWYSRWVKWLFKAPRPLSFQSHLLPTVSAAEVSLKIYSISDIHTDYAKNMEWIRSLPQYPQGSCLIVAGDVSHDLQVIETTLSVLKTKFDEVFYTVGNHELWLTKKDESDRNDFHSMDKLMSVLELCDRLNVRTRPTVINGDELSSLSNFTVASMQKQVLIIPLLSWYHSDLFPSTNQTLGVPTNSSSVDMAVLSDFEVNFDAQCKWPSCIGEVKVNEQTSSPKMCVNSLKISQMLSDMNEQVFEQFGLFSLIGENKTSSSLFGSSYRNETGGKVRSLPQWLPNHVVSYSHFLPDYRLFPGRRDLIHVMGSKALQTQVNKMRPNVHIFGHSHIRIDTHLSEYQVREHYNSLSASVPTHEVSSSPYASSTRFVQSYLGKAINERDRSSSSYLSLVWPPTGS